MENLRLAAYVITGVHQCFTASLIVGQYVDLYVHANGLYILRKLR